MNQILDDSKTFSVIASYFLSENAPSYQLITACQMCLITWLFHCVNLHHYLPHQRCEETYLLVCIYLWRQRVLIEILW